MLHRCILRPHAAIRRNPTTTHRPHRHPTTARRPRRSTVGKVDSGRVRLIFWDLGGQPELHELWDKVSVPAHRSRATHAKSQATVAGIIPLPFPPSDHSANQPNVNPPSYHSAN